MFIILTYSQRKMVKLFCLVVGDERVFPVDIGLDITVGYLMTSIKAALSCTIKAKVDKLQLFLAKHDGTWLEEADARNVTQGHLQSFEWMNPALLVNDAKYFGGASNRRKATCTYL